MGEDSVRLRKTYLLLQQMEAVGESKQLPEVAGSRREQATARGCRLSERKKESRGEVTNVTYLF